MSAEIGLGALLIIFLIHLMVFAGLGLRRREGYYLALVVTFGLLSLSIVFRLFLPTVSMMDVPVHTLLRSLALAATLVSVGWGLARFRQKRQSRQV